MMSQRLPSCARASRARHQRETQTCSLLYSTRDPRRLSSSRETPSGVLLLRLKSRRPDETRCRRRNKRTRVDETDRPTFTHRRRGKFSNTQAHSEFSPQLPAPSRRFFPGSKSTKMTLGRSPSSRPNRSGRLNRSRPPFLPFVHQPPCLSLHPPPIQFSRRSSLLL